MIPRHILEDLFEDRTTAHEHLTVYFESMVALKSIYESFLREGVTNQANEYIMMIKDVTNELVERTNEI